MTARPRAAGGGEKRPQTYFRPDTRTFSTTPCVRSAERRHAQLQGEEITVYARLREQFSPAALTLSVIAIVLALAGGAIAAGGGLSGKQKKEVKKIAKKYAGKPGDPGAAGTNGTNGKSVVLLNEQPTLCPNEEGFTYEIQDSADENEVCNGEQGDRGRPWTPRHLRPLDQARPRSGRDRNLGL